jgi:hypothetical protein
VLEFLQAHSGIPKSDQIEIRAFEKQDISLIVNEFVRHHWPKPQSTFDFYWHEQNTNHRFMWIAFLNGQLAATQSPVVGLGVGLYNDYGNAQKLYIKKGYVPNGYGVTYNYQAVITWGKRASG